MSSVWTKNQKRLEQIGLELALNNPEFFMEPSPRNNRNQVLPHELPILGLPNRASTRRRGLNEDIPRNQFSVNPDEPPTTTDQPPEDIFELLDDLGYGSSGNVVKMRHKPTGEICAVKQMRICDDDRDRTVSMDLRVILACKFEHIVRCYGYFIHGTDVWICMEPMTTCFDKLLRTHKRPFPERFLGAIACAAVKALDYLKVNHEIMHRDIKPSNILINEEDGQIKLCDFGVSGKLKDSMAKTKQAGSWAYLAPERLETDASTYDIRADVWSLGITLFELATTKSPYPQTAIAFEIMKAVVHGDAPRLPDDMEFSQEFRNFMQSCLTKDFKKRPKFKELLEHDFIRLHSNTQIRLSDYVDNVEQ